MEVINTVELQWNFCQSPADGALAVGISKGLNSPFSRTQSNLEAKLIGVFADRSGSFYPRLASAVIRAAGTCARSRQPNGFLGVCGW